MVHLKCIGLTAPHIGILKRIVTINIDNHITELVNPKIIDSLGKQKGKEGSISCLGQTVTIIKPKIIKVKAQNRFEKNIEIIGNTRFEIRRFVPTQFPDSKSGESIPAYAIKALLL